MATQYTNITINIDNKNTIFGVYYDPDKKLNGQLTIKYKEAGTEPRYKQLVIDVKDNETDLEPLIQAAILNAKKELRLSLSKVLKPDASDTLIKAIALLGLPEKFASSSIIASFKDITNKRAEITKAFRNTARQNKGTSYELNEANTLLTQHLEDLEQDYLQKNPGAFLDSLSDSVKTRTKDASRYNPSIHPTVSTDQKTFEKIQNEVTAINKKVEALLKTPDAQKFWMTDKRFQVAFPDAQRKELLTQKMIVPGEDGADQSVELQHASEYIKKRINAITTPLGKSTKEYKDLVAMKQAVEDLVKGIKDPRSTGQAITDKLLLTLKGIAYVVSGSLAIVGGAFTTGVAIIGGGTIIGIGVLEGLVCTLGYGAKMLKDKALIPVWHELVTTGQKVMTNVVEIHKNNNAMQAKARILTDLLSYEPKEQNDSKLTAIQANSLAEKLENALVLSEVYESLELGENLINDKHLSRIIELKMKAGTLSSDVSSKKTLEEKCDLYKNTIFLEKIKTEIKRLLGDKTEPDFINNKVSALEPLVKSKLMQTVSSKTWEEFNLRLEAAQAALVQDVRDTFKSKSPMANDTWHKCRAILKQADIARAGCSLLIEQRKTFEKLEQQSTASTVVEQMKAAGKRINAAITPARKLIVGLTLEEAINKQNELEQQWVRAQQRVNNLIKVISKLSGKEETPEDIKQRVGLEKELESLNKEASDIHAQYIKAYLYAGHKSQSKTLTLEISESETESETYAPPEKAFRAALKNIRDEDTYEKINDETKEGKPSLPKSK